MGQKGLAEKRDGGMISAEDIRAGDRRALARAITLVESARADHRAEALALLSAIGRDRQALRIGKRC